MRVHVVCCLSQFFVTLYRFRIGSRQTLPKYAYLVEAKLGLLFVVRWRQNTLFMTTELAKKAEITILSARDITGPGFHAGESWVVIQGYIRSGITRDGYIGLRTICVLRFVNSCSFGALSDVIPRLDRLFYFL